MSPERSVTYVSGLDPDRTGGESGIRTPDTVSRIPVFKTGAFNRSAISPLLLQFYYGWESSSTVPAQSYLFPIDY